MGQDEKRQRTLLASGVKSAAIGIPLLPHDYLIQLFRSLRERPQL
jgi:hypothetical protein